MTTEYKATISKSHMAQFDAATIEAASDIEAMEVASSWARGRGRGYTLELIDVSGDYPRDVMAKQY